MTAIDCFQIHFLFCKGGVGSSVYAFFIYLQKRMNEVSFLSALNKRIQSANYLRSVESIFKCPICGSSMRTSEFKSLICMIGHTFDFTKQGSINLLKHSVNTKYDKTL